MTENSENLRKFLDSDDPAMVMMGLSMAKTSEVPDDLLPLILSYYMWHDDKTIRAAAKSTFISLAPDKLKKKVKDNWKTSYRNLSPYGETYTKVIPPLLKLKDDMAIAVLYHLLNKRPHSFNIPIPLLIKTLDDKSGKKRSKAADALGDIAKRSYRRDKRAVPSLIKTLEDKDDAVRKSAVSALGSINDKKSVEPLIKLLESDTETSAVKSEIVKALTWSGDKRAVEPLIKTLEDNENPYIKDTVTALGRIKSKLAVEPLIKLLEKEVVGLDANSLASSLRGSSYYSSTNTLIFTIAEALTWIGDKRALPPLIKIGDVRHLRNFGAEGLRAIVDLGKGEDLRVDQLKEILKKEKLSTSGTKKTLIRRLTYQPPKGKIVKPKDSSVKNIRKLLESKDLVQIRTGLSMVEDGTSDLLEEILWLQLMHEESEIRKTAKSIFEKNTPEDVKLIVKENWKANYRTTKGKIGTNLCNLETNLKSIEFSIFDHLIKELENLELNMYVAEALGLLNDERAVEPLIKALRKYKSETKTAGAVARALGKIGTKKATGVLIKELYNHKQYRQLDEHIGEALGQNSDFRFFESCLKEIEIDALSRKKNISKKLLFDTLDSTNFSKLNPEEINEKLEGLIILLNYEDPQTKGTYQVESSSGGHYTVTDNSCTCMGYEFRSYCRHIEMVQTGTSKIKHRITKRSKTALRKIVEANLEGNEKENILKFLKNDDAAMIMMGASMLKGILKETLNN